jgi:hypothetical protein
LGKYNVKHELNKGYVECNKKNAAFQSHNCL